jgi:hypothetical protein
MNNNTLLGIYAEIQEIADVSITFYDNELGAYMLPEAEEEACRRAQKQVKAISDEPEPKPEPEPPKELTNWMLFWEEDMPREIEWAVFFYRWRTNLKVRWSSFCA